MAKKSKAKTPEQVAAEALGRRLADFAAVNLQPEAAALPKNDDIEARHAERTRVDGARRLDAFDANKKGMAVGAYDAARALEELFRIRMQEGDRGAGIPTVTVDDGAIDADHRRVLRRIEAAKKIEMLLARLGDRDAWLLQELIVPTHPWENWRAAVAHVTGEDNHPAQAAPCMRELGGGV